MPRELDVETALALLEHALDGCRREDMRAEAPGTYGLMSWPAGQPKVVKPQIFGCWLNEEPQQRCRTYFVTKQS